MHFYVHIPFCHEICPYCSFYKHKPGQTSQKKFITALLLEIDWWNTQHPSLTPNTIYLGGGTPSLLSKSNLELLFHGLRERLNLNQCQEITLEANPSTFNLEKAQLIKELGVTRISLGVQSFDDDLLKTLGRDHTQQDAIKSYQTLRTAEFPAINLDLMFSVPGQTIESWTQTLRLTSDLRPDHISAYNLTYEEDTAYFEKFLTGEYQDEADKNESLFLRADQQLARAGYHHYETSNYALPSAKSLHNQGYWMGNDYIGIGPSAVSCTQRTRTKNIADTSQYIRRIHAIGHAMEEREQLDDEAWRLERLALQLRTTSGIDLMYFEHQREEVQQLVETGLITTDEKTNTLQVSKRGSCLVDSIAEFLA